MAYNKTVWQDLPNQTTPVNAANLNKIENGIGDLDTGKQDVLVSGTNIKTINNQSILGDGNIYTHLYPTNETRIGTWKDGRPVYRKIITFTTVAGGGQVDTINNLDEIVDLKGGYVGQGNKFPPQYYLNNDYNLRTYSYGTGIFYACSGYIDYSADIVIDYIKTI